jgi:hypothetical protein
MSTFHLRALKTAIDELLDLGTLELYFMKPSYTPDAGTDQYLSDITNDLADNVTAVTLTGVSVAIDTTNDRVTIDSNDPVLDPITTSTDKYCLVVNTGNNATSPILLTNNITEGTVTPIAGRLSVTINAAGHGALTV